MFLVFHRKLALALQILFFQVKTEESGDMTSLKFTRQNDQKRDLYFTCVIERRDVEYPNILLRGTWVKSMYPCKAQLNLSESRLPILSELSSTKVVQCASVVQMLECAAKLNDKNQQSNISSRKF